MLLVQTNLVFMNLKMIQEVDLSCRAIHGLLQSLHYHCAILDMKTELCSPNFDDIFCVFMLCCVILKL